uniref:Uncharacterized protein n=1 Tax=Solanum lycopersicum TaxID=4081 RepID=A0A3Q7FRZ7_SOLLC
MFWRPHCPSFEQPYSDRAVEDFIARATRMPVVESSVHGYRNGHTMIKEERVIWEEQHNMHGNRYNYSFPRGIHQGYRAPEAQKKVHFVERDKTTETTEKKFHNEDDSFIQRNNKSNMYGSPSKYNFPSGYHYRSPPPEAQKKAHFVERDRTTEATEKKFDNEDDSFIQRNNKSNMYGNPSKYNFPSAYHHRSPPTEAQKKAHFVEPDKTTEVGRKEKHKVSEEKVDNEADNFIKRKHKNFELAKMDTFKVY